MTGRMGHDLSFKIRVAAFVLEAGVETKILIFDVHL